jgi:hypothetical protein
MDSPFKNTMGGGAAVSTALKIQETIVSDSEELSRPKSIIGSVTGSKTSATPIKEIPIRPFPAAPKIHNMTIDAPF